MMNEKSPLSVILTAGIAILLAALFGGALLFHPVEPDAGTVWPVSEWTMEGETVSLPKAFRPLSPRTPLTLTAQIQPDAGDYLYLKAVYTPLKVYADGALIFSYGQPGSYPALLLDPPTRVALIALPETAHPVTLTMEYLSPTQRDTATLHPVMVGTPDAIFVWLFSEMGFSLFFSIVLLALGMILVLISFVLTRFERAGISFLWLGLFSLCVGCWVLGECNLTGLFIKNPTLLYLMAFLGLFTMAIPLTRFGLAALGLRRTAPLRWSCLVLEVSVCVAALLQLFGVAALSKSMYLFHLLAPGSFCVFGGCVLFESVRYQNAMARRFLLPVSVVALFSVLEVMNYYLFHLNVQKSFFFQLGVLLFLVMVSVQCGYAMRDMFALREENSRLAHTVSMQDRQIEAQKERYRLLSETSAQIKQQRHDFKHHIAVIRKYLKDREDEQLTAYLDELYTPANEEAFETLCENEAVNTVALYYRSMARKAGISSCAIRLDIPKNTGKVPVQELCVVVGNLLENAVTACRGVERPFIRMQSRFANGILTITQDNSFLQVQQAADGTFCSQKPGGGIGLLSIRAVAEKYGGGTRFEAKDGVFSSSVYLHLS